MAILLALQWIEEKEINNSVIASASYSALMSIKTGSSSVRFEIIKEIFTKIHKMEVKGMLTCFLWVPAHVGMKGNEQVDSLATQTLQTMEVDLQIPWSKAEGKTCLRNYTQSVWQEYWDDQETGNLYKIQRHAGARRRQYHHSSEKRTKRTQLYILQNRQAPNWALFTLSSKRNGWASFTSVWEIQYQQESPLSIIKGDKALWYLIIQPLGKYIRQGIWWCYQLSIRGRFHQNNLSFSCFFHFFPLYLTLHFIWWQ